MPRRRCFPAPSSRWSSNSAQPDFNQVRRSERIPARPLAHARGARSRACQRALLVSTELPKSWMKYPPSDDDQFQPLRPECARRICLNAAIGDDSLGALDFANQGKAPAAELAGVGHHRDLGRNADHYIIELGFQNVRSGKADVGMQTIHGEEQVVRMQILQHSFGLRANEGTGCMPENSSNHNHRYAFRFGEFVSDV